MNFIREVIENKIHIRKKFYIKKGFTLIELMLVISLIGIITSVVAVVMERYMNIHRQEINSSRESFYVNEAFMIIQHEIDDAKYIKIKDNNVIVICVKEKSDYIKKNMGLDKERFNYIRKDKDSDIIISYGSEYFSTPNNILKNIKNFNVKKDKHVMYMDIETKKGNVYKRCFPIEREKEQEASS